jgi:hypothetical protein
VKKVGAQKTRREIEIEMYWEMRMTSSLGKLKMIKVTTILGRRE